MDRFRTQESIVAGFLSILNSAGMQSSFGSNKTKPRYYRGYCPPDATKKAIFLRYVADFNETVSSADNDDFMRKTEIGGEIYTKNGYGDATYQLLCYNIERYCAQNGYNIEWFGEDTDTSFDVNSPIAFKRFTVTKNKV